MDIELYIKGIYLNESKISNRDIYPFNLPVVHNLKSIKLESRVTFFAGENGTGKSTLIEAIAVNYGFNPEGGSKNFNFSTVETHSLLHEYITLIKGVKRPKDNFFLRAESFYNMATEIDELDQTASLVQYYGGKSLHNQSHGESFMSLILNRFSGNGIYILDEPEAALSPLRQFALLTRMNDLVKMNSQFIIATHSPILLAFPDADIFIISDEGIIKTPYEQTEHYILTKQFLNNTKRMLNDLLN